MEAHHQGEHPGVDEEDHLEGDHVLSLHCKHRLQIEHHEDGVGSGADNLGTQHPPDGGVGVTQPAEVGGAVRVP